jgi:hypothetical protein
MKADM